MMRQAAPEACTARTAATSCTAKDQMSFSGKRCDDPRSRWAVM